MQLKEIHQKLHLWYARYGRDDLPWRNTKDAYHIYISEVMLQQTQVKTVLERYYFPFLERFPTLSSLAKAPLDDVLKHWEGLGYYTRARNLHATAKLTAPSLPKEYEALLRLPGIGKNTASAICAFAYHQPLAVMEANVKRVLCRIHAYEKVDEKQLQEDALRLLDRQNPFDYNQAMMDIGAVLCTIQNPGCSICPFNTICKAYGEGYFLYPLKKRKVVPVREEHWLVQTYKGKVAMHQRKGKFLHGLWGFKRCESYHDKLFLGEVTQSYTHFKQVARIYHDSVSEEGKNFFDIEEIERVALSSVDKKVIKLLKKHKIL